MYQGTVYCKTHFLELFRRRGTYDFKDGQSSAPAFGAVKKIVEPSVQTLTEEVNEVAISSDDPAPEPLDSAVDGAPATTIDQGSAENPSEPPAPSAGSEARTEEVTATALPHEAGGDNVGDNGISVAVSAGGDAIRSA